MLVVVRVKLWLWEWQKVQDERASWEDPRNPLYKLSSIMERVFVQYMGSSRLDPVGGVCENLVT